MKIASFNDFRVGVVDGSDVYDMTDVLPDFLRELPRQRVNWLVANWSRLQARFADYRRAGRPLPLASVQLLAANPAPQHVFAAPANYQKHIGELGDRAV